MQNWAFLLLFHSVQANLLVNIYSYATSTSLNETRANGSRDCIPKSCRFEFYHCQVVCLSSIFLFIYGIFVTLKLKTTNDFLWLP